MDGTLDHQPAAKARYVGYSNWSAWRADAEQPADTSLIAIDLGGFTTG